jgi:hypothetical protein
VTTTTCSKSDFEKLQSTQLKYWADEVTINVLKDYRDDSLNFSEDGLSLLYAKNNTPASEFDRSNKSNDPNITVQFGVYRCVRGLSGLQCTELGECPVATWVYYPSVSLMSSSNGTVYLLVRAFSAKRSPITAPPNAAFPADVITLFRLNGHEFSEYVPEIVESSSLLRC